MADPLPRDQTVELLVKAPSEEDARKLAADVAGYTLGATIAKHGDGYFIVTDVFSLNELDGNFYSTIRASGELAILSDTSQKSRRDAVLAEAEKVEGQLRKLLLYVNGIEDYYNLFLRPYTKDHAENQTAIMAGKTDPVTSLLTFEAMLDILATDLSWAKHVINNPEELLKLLDGVEDFKALRKKLTEKLRPKLVWSVISESVLIKQYEWKEVAGPINKIKELRNRAAHFQILTDADVKDAKKQSKLILSMIGESNQKKPAQITYGDLPDIAAWIKELIDTPRATVAAAAAANQRALEQVIQAHVQSNRDVINAAISAAGTPLLDQLFPPRKEEEKAEEPKE